MSERIGTNVIYAPLIDISNDFLAPHSRIPFCQHEKAQFITSSHAKNIDSVLDYGKLGPPLTGWRQLFRPCLKRIYNNNIVSTSFGSHKQISCVIMYEMKYFQILQIDNTDAIFIRIISFAALHTHIYIIMDSKIIIVDAGRYFNYKWIFEIKIYFIACWVLFIYIKWSAHKAIKYAQKKNENGNMSM